MFEIDDWLGPFSAWLSVCLLLNMGEMLQDKAKIIGLLFFHYSSILDVTS